MLFADDSLIDYGAKFVDYVEQTNFRSLDLSSRETALTRLKSSVSAHYRGTLPIEICYSVGVEVH